jgi:endonuclease YncB( thermonuclease family)
MQNILYKDTKPFIPPITGGKVIKVYDGDTITIASKLPYVDSELYRFSVRIKHIDCPEIRTNNPIEKRVGLLAKQFVYDKCYDKIVEIKNLSTEKYGRILADIFIDNINIGDELVKHRLAVRYDGGRKHVPNNWEEYYEHNNVV